MKENTTKQLLAEKEQESKELHSKSLKWSNFERPYKMIRFGINGLLMLGGIYCWVIFIWYQVFGTHPEWAPWALPLAIIATLVFIAEKIFYFWFLAQIREMQFQEEQLEKEIEELKRRI